MSSASPASGPTEPHHKVQAERVKRSTTIWVALISLVGGLLAGGFSINNITNNAAADEKTTVTATVPAPPDGGPIPDPTTISTTVTATKTITTAAPSPSPSPTTGPQGVVRRQGLLSITSEGSARGADLDAQASDPDWGRTEATGDGHPEGPQLTTTDFGFYTEGNPGIHFLGTSEANYGVCSSYQNYEYERTPVGDMTAGTFFCFRTSAGRFGMMKVTKEATGQNVELDVTVWQK